MCKLDAAHVNTALVDRFSCCDMRTTWGRQTCSHSHVHIKRTVWEENQGKYMDAVAVVYHKSWLATAQFTTFGCCFESFFIHWGTSSLKVRVCVHAPVCACVCVLVCVLCCSPHA